MALVSAAIAATAVALYLDRPVTEVREPAGGPRALPESWLNVQVDEVFPGGPAPELAELLAGHPANATVTAPLGTDGEDLVGLPPGSYLVRVSCRPASTPEQPATDPEPRLTVEITDPATGGPAPATAPELACDGELQTVADDLTVTEYRAVHVTASTGPAQPSQVLVAISFTPTG
ncbi:MAG TPA: hypothetical protein VIL37_13330 [Natronosporangium sp.]